MTQVLCTMQSAKSNSHLVGDNLHDLKNSFGNSSLSMSEIPTFRTIWVIWVIFMYVICIFMYVICMFMYVIWVIFMYKRSALQRNENARN